MVLAYGNCTGRFPKSPWAFQMGVEKKSWLMENAQPEFRSRATYFKWELKKGLSLWKMHREISKFSLGFSNGSRKKFLAYGKCKA